MCPNDAKYSAGGAAKGSAAKGDQLDEQRISAGISLLFAPGDRPTTEDIERQAAASSRGGPAWRVSHRPGGEEGWLELLAHGLTFDINGLETAQAPAPPDAEHFFGLDPDIAATPLEAVSLVPGPHVASGGAMAPVVRTMVGLAADLALRLPAKAVCWRPARSWMEPGYFARIVTAWLAGGAFPALGLTAIVRSPAGAAESVGLAFFAGQEVAVEVKPGEPFVETVKLAARMIDHIIRHGAIVSAGELQGPTGERLLAEPSPDGRHVEICRSA
jgi:hypothetical protein